MMGCTQSLNNNTQNTGSQMLPRDFKKELFFKHEVKDSLSLKLKIAPSDVELKIDENCFLALFKESFLDLDGNPVEDSIVINISIVSNPSSSFRLLNLMDIDEIYGFHFLINYSVLSSRGKEISINENKPPRLMFHPKSEMVGSSYGYYDSSTRKWSLPILTKSISKRPQKLSANEYVMVVDHLNGGDTTYRDLYGNEIMLHVSDKKDSVLHFLSLKNSGIYYVTRNPLVDKIDVDLTVEIECENNTIDMKNFNIYALVDHDGYKCHTKAKYFGSGLFYFDDPSPLSKLILPKTGQLTIIGFSIQADRIYFSEKKSIPVRNRVLETLIMKEVSFEELITSIESL